jgi:hypothetical protein
MAETKTGSGGWGLDAMAAKLQSEADELLHSTPSTNEDGTPATTGGKREALMNVANIVKEHAGKGLESSKDYLSKVVEKVSAYTTDASTTASTHIADAKDKAAAQFKTTSETANTHLAGLQTNLNRAIAQGQGQATSTSTDSEATDRALPTEEEPLKFPFNFIAWLVGLCHGKGTSTTTTTLESTTATSKDFSVESLQNAAATLTETLSHEAQAAREQLQATGEKAVTDASESIKEAAPSAA